jgi:excisionase family DNA binding protein
MALLSVKQAAERLQVAPTTVYGLCAGKKLGHLRVGAGRGTIRIREDDLQAYMERATIPLEDETGTSPVRSSRRAFAEPAVPGRRPRCHARPAVRRK